MDIDKCTFIECNICFAYKFIFYTYPCCKQIICDSCNSRLVKAPCPFCRSELKFSSNPKYHIVVFKNEWFVTEWDMLYQIISTYLPPSAMNQLGIVPEITRLWETFVIKLLKLYASKKIEIVPYSKQKTLWNFFRSATRKKELTLSGMLSSKENIFIPYTKFFQNKNQVISMEECIWSAVKSQTKIDLLKDAGLWKQIQHKIDHVNELIENPCIRFYDIDPMKTWLTLQNDQIVNLLEYSLISLPDAEFKVCNENEQKCLFKHYVIGTECAGLVQWKGLENAKHWNTKWIRVNDPKFLQECLESEEGKKFTAQYVIKNCLSNSEENAFKAMIIRIVKRNSPIFVQRLVDDLYFQNRRMMNPIQLKGYDIKKAIEDFATTTDYLKLYDVSGNQVVEYIP